MLSFLRNKKGQNTAEYAILIIVVITAFLVLQIYVRKAIQARVKAGTDNIPGLVTDNANATGVTTATLWGTGANATQFQPDEVPDNVKLPESPEDESGATQPTTTP